MSGHDVLNASIRRCFEFLDNIVRAYRKRKFCSDLHLKADGGTMGIDDAYRLPVQSVLSGPGEFHGNQRFEEMLVDWIYLDIGGTTTDIFFLRRHAAV